MQALFDLAVDVHRRRLLREQTASGGPDASHLSARCRLRSLPHPMSPSQVWRPLWPIRSILCQVSTVMLSFNCCATTPAKARPVHPRDPGYSCRPVRDIAARAPLPGPDVIASYLHIAIRQLYEKQVMTRCT